MKHKLALSCLAAMAACGTALAENRITVDVNKVVAPAAEDLWGIFFEDIDLSLDGGVYAEMVRNRSFEDGDRLGYWDAVGAAKLESCKEGALSEKNAHYCRLTAKAAGATTLFTSTVIRFSARAVPQAAIAARQERASLCFMESSSSMLGTHYNETTTRKSIPRLGYRTARAPL